MRGNAQPDGRPLGGSELQSYFGPIFAICGPKYKELCLPVRECP